MTMDIGGSLAPGTYPTLSVQRIENPDRVWAVPILGIVFKAIILIPVFIWLYILSLASFVVVILINPLVVLFTGRYWDAAYGLLIGFLRVETRTIFYLAGLTNSYPGFGFEDGTDKLVSINIDMPTAPNRGLAIPLIGGFIRIVVLIPYLVWAQVLGSGAGLASVVASFPVLFSGRYPESLYELVRDAVRVNLSSYCYLYGLSDSYPSFSISMNSPAVKWLFIILGALLAFTQFTGQLANSMSAAQRGR